MIAGAVIGLVSGLGVVAFYGLIDASYLLLTGAAGATRTGRRAGNHTRRLHLARVVARHVHRAASARTPRDRTFPKCSSPSRSAEA
jgi:hypothetical protein